MGRVGRSNFRTQCEAVEYRLCPVAALRHRRSQLENSTAACDVAEASRRATTTILGGAIKISGIVENHLSRRIKAVAWNAVEAIQDVFGPGCLPAQPAARVEDTLRRKLAAVRSCAIEAPAVVEDQAVLRPLPGPPKGKSTRGIPRAANRARWGQPVSGRSERKPGPPALHRRDYPCRPKPEHPPERSRPYSR